MGCVYSNQNSSGSGGSSRRKKSQQNSNGAAGAGANVELNPIGGGGDSPNSPVHGSSSNRNRIYDVEVCNVEKEGIIHGQLEITDTNLIYRLKGRSPIIWPLRFLRSYGHDKDIFSFECGRRCPTGEGVYVFKCSKAEQLFQTLLDVINSATTLNASNGAINNPSGPLVQHSNSLAANNNSCLHEYQNLTPFEGNDIHGNFGTLPSRLTAVNTTAANDPMAPRPHSSVGTAPISEIQHTYLNSSSLTHHPHPPHSHQHLIRGDSGGGGIKTTPNYYTTTSQPGTSMVSSTSCQNCSTATGGFFSQHSVGSTGSRGSLNGNGVGPGGGILGGRRSSASNHSSGRDCFDSNTLPPLSRTAANRAQGSLTFHHDRKNSEQHLYENHEVPTTSTLPSSSAANLTTASRLRKLEAVSSNMTASDDLSTFCYVNLNGGAETAAAASSSLTSANASRRQHFFQDKPSTSSNIGSHPLHNPHNPLYNHNHHHHHFQTSSKSARTTPEPRLSYIQLDLKNNNNNNNNNNKEMNSSAASKTKSESLKVTGTAAAIDRGTLEKKLSSPTSGISFIKEKTLVNGSSSSKVRKGSGGSLTASSLLATVPPTSSSAAAAAISSSSSTVPGVNGDIMREVKLTKGDAPANQLPAAAAAASVPYAQIDFAKTLALSNSAANHRKL